MTTPAPGTCRSLSLTAGRRAGLLLVGLALVACGGAQVDEATTPSPAEETAAAEEAGMEEAAGAEPSDSGADEGPGAGAEVPCTLPATAPSAERQAAVFRRWLQDQCYGRHVTVEAFEPLCGDRGGSFVALMTLRGTSGELLSLGRALEAYYPGSSWEALDHERLGGVGARLRLRTEVEVPVGATPRPRCTWDPAVSCP